MATVSYPTSLSVPGPWLLAQNNLASLDRIIDSYAPTMQERRNELIKSRARKHLERYEQEDISEEALRKKADDLRKLYAEDMPAETRRRLVIYMTGGRSAEGETFEELSNLPHMSKEIPTGFSLSTRCADIEVSVRLSSSVYKHDLDVSVSCADRELAQELFGKLDNWVSDLQPPKWTQIWLKSHPPVFFSVFIVFMVSLITFAIVTRSQPQPGPSLVSQQALELARAGVNPSNEAKAIQLLLDLETGYEPAPRPIVRRYPSSRVWAYYALGLSVLLAFTFPPKGALGIWGGKRSLERQRAWIRFVAITVPGLFVGSFFVPWLLHLLGFPG